MSLARLNPGHNILLIEALSLQMERSQALRDKTIPFAIMRMKQYIKQGVDPLKKDEYGKTCADHLREIDHPLVREFVWQCDRILIERSLEQDYRPSWIKARAKQQDSTPQVARARRRAM